MPVSSSSSISVTSSPTSATSSTGINTDVTISGGNWAADTYTGQGQLAGYGYVVCSLTADETGTLFFDFSTDNSNWSPFPVAGFSVASGIHEFHAAYVGEPRYFRIRFVGDGGRSFFRLETWFTSTPVHLSSPLSQGISTDQDATVVKAIVHGEDATMPGTFVQQLMTEDGAAHTSPDNSIINFSFDAYDYTATSTTVDTWTYYQGGLAGTAVATVTITYTDTSKAAVQSAVRANL